MKRMIRSLRIGLLVLLASCKKDPPAPAAADAAADAAPATAAADAATTVVDAAAEAGETAAIDSGTPISVKPVPRPTTTANQELEAICQKARAAKARNSPAAASLDAKCRAMGGSP
ncbi:MAG: hypothetical protein JST00_20440 [Deltaproteobacteria bacterium]|nr:hypothetical protein [Deltaproteobacteria bacterium]